MRRTIVETWGGRERRDKPRHSCIKIFPAPVFSSKKTHTGQGNFSFYLITTAHTGRTPSSCSEDSYRNLLVTASHKPSTVCWTNSGLILSALFISLKIIPRWDGGSWTWRTHSSCSCDIYLMWSISNSTAQTKHCFCLQFCPHLHGVPYTTALQWYDLPVENDCERAYGSLSFDSRWDWRRYLKDSKGKKNSVSRYEVSVATYLWFLF